MADISPVSLHAEGLESSLAGKFNEAQQLFGEARQMFLECETPDTDPNIDVGRVDRDMARVFAGLGAPALRDTAIKSACELHWKAYAEPSNQDNPKLSSSELAASWHVRARIALAKSQEDGVPRSGEMARDWGSAYNLLTLFGGNKDYLEQVIAHGSLALSVFGRRQSLGLVDEMLHNQVIANMPNNRRQAVAVAGKLLLARRVFVPVGLIPAVRSRALEAVAGPYLIR